MEYPVQTNNQLHPYLLGFRKAAGYTQTQMAQRLNITQQRYARLEARPEAVSLEQLLKVFQLLGVDFVLRPAARGTAPQDGERPDTIQPPMTTQTDRW
ncbi:helix-turn-helix transcriptional regulator [Paludibacterium sp.]|uniref:helix-turn-helix transcriptional regulator n=1 Tax=Paludibacterium sp. TaxID=1917523 RepID=UPI0025F660C6|nr:helix-turn-helix transcriptional regulator [Paludibacterium sp.]MBV8647183.1 helix-turn-helix transcriptional regulator [Paludibacterium sp.]